MTFQRCWMFVPGWLLCNTSLVASIAETLLPTMRPGSLFDAPDHFGFAPILADNGWEAQWQRRRHRKGVCTWGDAQAVCIRMEGSTSCSSFSASVLLLYQGGHLVLADGVLSTKILSSFRVGQCVAYCKPLGAVLRWESRETKRIRNVYETYSHVNTLHSETLKLFCTVSISQWHQQSVMETNACYFLTYLPELWSTQTWHSGSLQYFVGAIFPFCCVWLVSG